MALSYKNDNQSDERLSPYEQAKRLHEQEQQAAFGSDSNDIADNLDNTADSSQEDRNIDRTKQLGDREQNPSSANNPMNYRQGGSSTKPIKLSGSRLTRRKGILVTLGLGGISLPVALIFFALMPMKMEMFIQNITSAASRVPSYAINQRAEYLTTRALATRILLASDSSIDGKLVFCSNRGVACSLFATYTADYFEKKMDLSMERQSNGDVRVSIVAQGRERLGGRAKYWEITRTDPNLSDEARLTTVMRTIDNNPEMKKYIGDTVRKNYKGSNIVTRYIARKALMKKYGVTRWRAFEKTQNRIEDTRSTIKSNITRNTIGKVTPRAAMYLACIEDGASCRKLLSSLSRTPQDLEAIKQQHGENSNQYRRAQKQQEAINNITNSLDGNVPDDTDPNVLRKVMSNRLVQLAGASLGPIAIADLAFSAIGSIDDGALELISYDMASQVYTGLAYGDDTGLVVNNDLMKAQFIEGTPQLDLEVFGELSSLLDGAESSPLMQQENGIVNSSVASAASGVTRECSDPSEDDGTKLVRLPPGELVCPERKLVRDYTSQFVANPMWGVMASVADVWNSSVGVIFDLLGESIGYLISKVDVFNVIDTLGAAMEPLINWVMTTVFDPPFVGPGETGANNYDALSGAIRLAQNETMENGIDSDGSPLGAGGTVLSDTQVAQITQEQLQIEQQEFNNQTMIAKIFNPQLKNSVAQKLALTAPTSVSKMLSYPAMAMRQFAFGGQAANAATAVSSPFGLPIYGYAPGDPVLQADPGIYTEEKCRNLAAAREESYTRNSDTVKISPLPIYTKSDPCALEKVTVGSMLINEGVYDDEHSLPSIDGTTPEGSTLGGNSGSGDSGQPGTPSNSPSSWVSPVPSGVSYRKTSGYGVNRGSYIHRGQDLAYRGDFLSICDGVIEKIDNKGDRNSYGNMTSTNVLRVACDGGEDIFVQYHHYYYRELKPNIKIGARVRAGQPLAPVGNQGNSSGYHLHMEIHKGTKYPAQVNPIQFLRGKGVNL